VSQRHKRIEFACRPDISYGQIEWVFA
jgi:hypothetical protein